MQQHTTVYHRLIIPGAVVIVLLFDCTRAELTKTLQYAGSETIDGVVRFSFVITPAYSRPPDNQGILHEMVKRGDGGELAPIVRAVSENGRFTVGFAEHDVGEELSIELVLAYGYNWRATMKAHVRRAGGGWVGDVISVRTY